MYILENEKRASLGEKLTLCECLGFFSKTWEGHCRAQGYPRPFSVCQFTVFTILFNTG